MSMKMGKAGFFGLVLVCFVVLFTTEMVAMAQAKGNYETYISSGHTNNPEEIRGHGWGWLSNNMVVQSFSSGSSAWVNPETPTMIDWNSSISLGGSFIPDDGHMTPEMNVALLLGYQTHNHYHLFETARYGGEGDDFYITYEPTLAIYSSASGRFDPGDSEEGWLPSGWGQVQLDVTNGFITHSNSQLTILDNSAIDGTRSWNAYFNFQGISIPDKMTIVPEPATMSLLGLGGAILFRRRRNWHQPVNQ